MHKAADYYTSAAFFWLPTTSHSLSTAGVTGNHAIKL
jgi:hypothetical protein